MSTSREGGCLCGAVRYELTRNPKRTGICHCRACQKTTGAPYVVLLVVPEYGFEITGELISHATEGDSGGMNTRSSCAKCGSHIFQHSTNLPRLRLITANTLDDPSWVKPQFHVWLSSKQPWVAIDDDLPRHEQGPGS